jgi:hypothetical protein
VFRNKPNSFLCQFPQIYLQATLAIDFEGLHVHADATAVAVLNASHNDRHENSSSEQNEPKLTRSNSLQASIGTIDVACLSRIVRALPIVQSMETSNNSKTSSTFLLE